MKSCIKWKLQTKKKIFELRAEEIIKKQYSTTERWEEFEKLLRYFEDSERQLYEKKWRKNSENETPPLLSMLMLPSNYSFIRRFIALRQKFINTCETITSIKNIKLDSEYFYKTFMFEYCYIKYPDVSPEDVNIGEALEIYIQTLKGTKTKKSYKSKNRAYGIALALAYLNDKIDYDTWNSKTKLQKIAIERLRINNDGDRAERAAKEIYRAGEIPKENELDRVKKNYALDYNFGLNLYKKHF